MKKPMDNKSPEIVSVIESIFPGTKAAIDNHENHLYPCYSTWRGYGICIHSNQGL